MIASSGGKVLLDSCFLVRCRAENSGQALETLVHKLLQGGFTFFVTRSILREVDRLAIKSIPDAVEGGAWALLTKHLVFLDDRTPEIVWEAQRILTHPPDNMHIAAAKLEGAAIVSFDRLLLRIARAEGIEAYDPQQLLDRLAN